MLFRRYRAHPALTNGGFWSEDFSGEDFSGEDAKLLIIQLKPEHNKIAVRHLFRNFLK